MKKANLALLLSIMLIAAMAIFIGCKKKSNGFNQDMSRTAQPQKISVSTISGKVIATINFTTGDIAPTYNANDLEAYLLGNFGYFNTIGNIELTYNDPANGVSYLTVTGTDDSGTVAIQVDIFAVGTDLVLQEPNDDTDELIRRHACQERYCTACAFNRNWLGRITGCECTIGTGICNHIISTGVIEYPDLYAYFD